MTATSIESIASTPFFVKTRLIANPLAGLLPELFTVFACGRLVVSRHGQSRMELYVVYLAIDRQVNDHGRLSSPMVFPTVSVPRRSVDSQLLRLWSQSAGIEIGAKPLPYSLALPTLH